MTAAATVIPLNRPKDAKKALGYRQDWQEEAWAFFDDVPELKQATWFLGNAVSKLRLFIAFDPGDGEPQAVDSAGDHANVTPIAPAVVAQAKVELARLRSPLGGQGEILRQANMNLEIAGEGYLIGRAAREQKTDPLTGTVTQEATAEEWDIRSVSEVIVKGTGASQTYAIKSSPGDRNGTPLDPNLDTIVRIYQRHPRWSGLADCALRGVLGECESLTLLSRQVLAEAKSKMSAGAFTLPNELSTGPIAADAGGESFIVGEDGQEARNDPFMDDMSQALTGPIEGVGDPSETTPFLIRGPAEYLKPDVLRRIDFSRDTAKELETKISGRVMRLARGLNLPLEVVIGHQGTTFANAEQVDEDVYEDHLEPRCVLLVDALTIGFLRAQLNADDSPVKGHPDNDRVMVWYDPSAVIKQPDREENATEGLTGLAISWKAWRAAKGFTDEDAPDENELLMRTGLLRGNVSPDLTLALLQLLGQSINVVAMPGDPAAAAPAVAGSAAAHGQARVVAQFVEFLQMNPRWLGIVRHAVGIEQPAIAASGRPSRRVSSLGRRLMDIDRDLRSKLLVAADTAVDAALAKAGNRLRTKLQGKRGGGLTREMSAVQPTRLAGLLGPDGMARLGVDPEDLLDGAFTELEGRFMAWGATAQEQAIELVSQFVSGLSVAERDALKLRQAGDLQEAWSWLEGSLRVFTHSRLLGPSAAAEPLGELAAALDVPPGMIRQAIARAGGATLETTGVGGDVWTALHPDGSPLGGIGTGDLLMDTLSSNGAGVEGYRWSYGPAARARPFDPHVELDGVEFSNFDDDVLANGEGFPDLPYYTPGDHSGCICDVEPIILSPEGA